MALYIVQQLRGAEWRKVNAPTRDRSYTFQGWTCLQGALNQLAAHREGRFGFKRIDKPLRVVRV